MIERIKKYWILILVAAVIISYNIGVGRRQDSSEINQLLNTQQTISTEVYITRTGEKYHRSSCRYLNKSKIPIEVDDAIKGGYSPCSVCKP